MRQLWNTAQAFLTTAVQSAEAWSHVQLDQISYEYNQFRQVSSWAYQKAKDALPDTINLSGDVGVMIGVGPTFNLSFTWILKGPAASFLPHAYFTASLGIGGFFPVGAGATLGHVRGNINDLTPGNIATRTTGMRSFGELLKNLSYSWTGGPFAGSYSPIGNSNLTTTGLLPTGSYSVNAGITFQLW